MDTQPNPDGADRVKLQSYEVLRAVSLRTNHDKKPEELFPKGTDPDLGRWEIIHFGAPSDNTGVLLLGKRRKPAEPPKVAPESIEQESPWKIE